VGEATLQLAQDYSDLVHGCITGVEPAPSTQR
jgi:branched-chain amino acid aminotransferase